jgi:hypothetical protein
MLVNSGEELTGLRRSWKGRSQSGEYQQDFQGRNPIGLAVSTTLPNANGARSAARLPGLKRGTGR